MLDLIERHRILFFFIMPIMMLGGMAFAPIALVVVAVGVIVLFLRGEHDSILLLFMFTLIMGDSRADFLQFIKPLRGELLLLMFIMTLYELRTNYYRANALLLSFLPFFWISILALIFSPTLPTAVSKTISFGVLYFVAFNYIHHKFERYGIQVMVDLLYLCLAILATGFMMLPVAPELVSYGGVRYNGLMGNPNGMGMFVTMLCPIAYYLFRRNLRLSIYFRVSTWLLLIISLLMCSSRNAIFSVALFFLMVIGLRGSTFRRISFLFIFLPIVGLLVYNIDLEQVVTAFGLEAYFRIQEFGSGSGRIFAWQHAIDLIQKSPLIGCGFACEEYFFVEKTSFQLWHSGHQGGVHNSFLAFAVNTGIVGLFCFLGFIGNAARKVRNFQFLIPFLCSMVFSAVFESWLFSSLGGYNMLFLITLIFAIVDTNREELLVSATATDFSNQAAGGNIR